MKHLLKNTVYLIILSIFLSACATAPPPSVKTAEELPPMQEAVITVNHQTFSSEIIEHPGPAVVLFYNSEFWQSNDMLKRLEWMAEKFSGKTKFAKFHWQVSDDASRFKLEMLPTVILYQSGAEIDRIKGIPPAEKDRIKWNDDLELWFLKNALGLKGSSYAAEYTYKFNNDNKLKIGNY